MCEHVLKVLTRGGLEHAVFGSAAGAVYGWSRPPRDIDIVVRCTSIHEVMALFPHADRVPPNGLRLGDVEVWAAPLILRSGDRVHTLCFDHALSTRRLAHPTFGWVLSAEDQLTLKLTLRRDEPGKCDLDDAVALLRHWEGRLDRDYLAWRAEQTGVSDLVREVFS